MKKQATQRTTHPLPLKTIEYVKIQALIYLQCVVKIFLVRVK